MAQKGAGPVICGFCEEIQPRIFPETSRGEHAKFGTTP
jgi:hypothetical protein